MTEEKAADDHGQNSLLTFSPGWGKSSARTFVSDPPEFQLQLHQPCICARLTPLFAGPA